MDNGPVGAARTAILAIGTGVLNATGVASAQKVPRSHHVYPASQCLRLQKYQGHLLSQL